MPLLPEGEDVARRMRPFVSKHPFSLVLSSPLARARRTAELIGLGDQATIDPDLEDIREAMLTMLGLETSAP